MHHLRTAINRQDDLVLRCRLWTGQRDSCLWGRVLVARSHLLPRIHVLGMANLVPPAEVPTWKVPGNIG